MKKALLFCLFLFLFFPQQGFSHASGMPPFFKINGVLPDVHPLQIAEVTTLSFDTPQDLAKENFYKDQEITFEIDTKALSSIFAEDVIKNTKYEWDFGDNTKGSGTKNKHKYTKTGSLTLSVNATFPNQPDESVLIESVQLNILPDKNYKLAQPIILVNGKKVNNPLEENVNVDLNNEVTFDASQSKAGTANIVSFAWEFGDGKKSNKQKTQHSYKLPQFYITPALRIIDADGFIVDTPINLRNSGKNDENNVIPKDDMATPFPIQLLIGGFLLGIGLLVFYGFKRTHKKNK